MQHLGTLKFVVCTADSDLCRDQFDSNLAQDVPSIHCKPQTNDWLLTSTEQALW